MRKSGIVFLILCAICVLVFHFAQKSYGLNQQIVNGVVIIDFEDLLSEDRGTTTASIEEFGTMAPFASHRDIFGFRSIILGGSGTVRTTSYKYNDVGGSTAPAGFIKIRGYENTLLTVKTANSTGTFTIGVEVPLGTHTVASDAYVEFDIGSNTTLVQPIHERASALRFGYKLDAVGNGSITYMGVECWTNVGPERNH